MELIDLAAKGTPFLLLGLLITVVRLGDQVKSISDELREIKKKIRFTDTCDERHKEVDNRLAKLENATGLNGA